ncbi:SDR family NAD(P)-dependent oxidoreductase [Tautonia rosea]|uniref:SDR family NAD(P)-dependent oxidoreductase n=1 Tax=Tautonia rosea TaxID=2728037 RepID=UPI001473DE7E|nr:SDR family NAD(P)-dependent oxidoreductase [Tautonia rosea]
MTRPGGRLDGRSCLIVGGTGGIGLATAERFLAEGARVVVSGKTPEEASEAMSRLGPLGPVWSEQADVSDEDSVIELFDRAVAWLGERLDVLVHVAGISGRRFGDGPLDACTLDGWETVMGVNARGVFLTNREAVRRMITNCPGENLHELTGLRGSIVNVGSVLARSPAPDYFGTIAYAASKGAIESLTRAAAARYARDGIRINLIAPGLIETPMATRAVNDLAIRHYLHTKQPMAGGPGSALDVAEAALFLAEPASRFLTGVVLEVDGGWSLSDGQLLNG